jgi:hypothetical protein
MAEFTMTGRFRGRCLSWAVGKSKGGFPQFVVRLLALERFNPDPENGGWEDYSEYEMEIVAYLILFNATEAMLNYDCVQRAFNWDGVDYGTLQDGDYSNHMIQFEVEDHEWNDEIRKQVSWVDEYDANPTRTLTPMNAEGLQALTAQFGHLMNQGSSSKPAPASKKASSKKKASKKAASKKKASKKAAAPSAPPAPPAPPTRQAEPETPATGALPAETSKEDAWAFLLENRGRDVSDDAVANAFIDGCETVGDDEDEFTPTDWATVRDHAAEVLEIVPF